MEHALYINDLSELALWGPDYRRLYFGNEFCNWKIPSLSEIKEIVEFARSKNIALTIVTSYCRDAELQYYRKIIEYLKQECPEFEIVINDWGMYRLGKELQLKIALGRLLVKQKRDPRIPEFITKLHPEARKRLKDIGLNNSLLNFLKKENIDRIELDNILQGLDLTHMNNNFVFSLHVPFVYIALTRYCKFNIKYHGERFKFSSCNNKQCKTMEIYNKKMRRPIFMRGNTLFYKNDLLPDDIEQSKINRLVYAADALK